MMWKRYRWWLLGLPVAFFLGLSLWWVLREPHSITLENSTTIQSGMTLAEVEALVGANHERSRMPAGGSHFICIYSEDDATSAVPGNVIAVEYDGDNRVVNRSFHQKGPLAAPGRLKRLIREWLGL
jgi:hypothetical protein